MSDGKVLISYRRGSDSHAAGRIHDRLEILLGRDRLFYDIDSIPLGVDFHDYLDQQVAACRACIVVIGRGWLDDIPRLHDEDDFVRIELAAALRRPGVSVIPLILQGAAMPARDALPPPLQALTRRHGVSVPDDHFASVVDGRIAAAVRSAVATADAPLPKPPEPAATHPSALAPGPTPTSPYIDLYLIHHPADLNGLTLLRTALASRGYNIFLPRLEAAHTANVSSTIEDAIGRSLAVAACFGEHQLHKVHPREADAMADGTVKLISILLPAGRDEDRPAFLRGARPVILRHLPPGASELDPLASLLDRNRAAAGLPPVT